MINQQNEIERAVVLDQLYDLTDFHNRHDCTCSDCELLRELEPEVLSNEI